MRGATSPSSARGASTSRFCSASATPPATGATSWSASLSKTSRSRASSKRTMSPSKSTGRSGPSCAPAAAARLRPGAGPRRQDRDAAHQRGAGERAAAEGRQGARSGGDLVRGGTTRRLLRRRARRLRRGSEISHAGQSHFACAVLSPHRRRPGAEDARAYVRGDGQRRDLRPARRRLPSLFDRRCVAEAALREDAL
jgi:hypothetical protein